MELFLNKTTNLSFDILIEGTTEPLKEARLTFYTTSPILSFKGNIENEKLNFSISNLKKYLNEGEYPVKLEIFVENSCFVTYEGTAIIKTPILAKSSLIESNINKNNNEINIKTKIETKNEKLEEKIKYKTTFGKFLEEDI